VTFNIVNQGRVSHEFKVCSRGTSDAKNDLANDCNAVAASARIPPGGSTSLAVSLKSPGTYEYLCALAGHAAAGMKGLLTVR
jgi:uncharacterized cupredoxin-like copper-binding protein